MPRTVSAETRAKIRQTSMETAAKRHRAVKALEDIRQASLTWAMACHCDCPACVAFYDVVKGSSGHPTGDGG